jgi:hypothetical protein
MSPEAFAAWITAGLAAALLLFLQWMDSNRPRWK